jgi:hypothetical protein
MKEEKRKKKRKSDSVSTKRLLKTKIKELSLKTSSSIITKIKSKPSKRKGLESEAKSSKCRRLLIDFCFFGLKA